MGVIPVEAIVRWRDEYEPGLAAIGYDINNTWFGAADAEMLYVMVRRLHPARIIEVGSGYSTSISLAAMRANLRDGYTGSITAIDPDPRLELDPVVDHRRTPLERAPRELFDGLVERDIVFIDSSHIWAPGNDVDILYREILPALPAGVVVHVHDIFLPDPYPWHDRGYDEQEHLARLLEGGGWDVLWAGHQVDRAVLAATFSSFTAGRGAGSFWMEKL